MKTSRTLLAAVALLGLAACSDSKSTSTTTPATAAATTAADGSSSTSPAAGAATVVLSDSSLGKILTTADGMTLYLFTPDTATSSACTEGCATAWPPLTSAAVGGEGLDAAQFGTLDRGDGTTQVTYHGHPLYLFSGDTAAGDVTGQGSGGKWYVVTSEGTAVDG